MDTNNSMESNNKADALKRKPGTTTHGLGNLDAICDSAQRKTEILKQQTLRNAEEKAKWFKPYDTYGRKRRKIGHGFEMADVLHYFITFNDTFEDVKKHQYTNSFTECIDRHIQECKNEDEIKKGYKERRISSSERDTELEKIAEQREAFLHLTAIAYLGFRTARYDALKDHPQASDKKRQEMKSSIDKMREITMKLAKASFYKHNQDLNQEALSQMCEENGTAYNIFKATIDELSDLFAKHFRESPDAALAYNEKMSSQNTQMVLAHLEYLLDLPHMVSAIPQRNRLVKEIKTADLEKAPTSTD